MWGTCAGMILMAEEDGVGGGKKKGVKGWGGVKGLKVWRNLYGSEFHFSFTSLQRCKAVALTMRYLFF